MKVAIKVTSINILEKAASIGAAIDQNTGYQRLVLHSRLLSVSSYFTSQQSLGITDSILFLASTRRVYYRQTPIVRASRLCHKSAGTLAALSSRRPGEHEDIEL